MENQHRKIKGYRDLSAREIELMNQLKAKAEEVRELLDQVALEPDIESRWLSIGKTDLQKGFMSVVRAIARQETF